MLAIKHSGLSEAESQEWTSSWKATDVFDALERSMKKLPNKALIKYLSKNILQEIALSANGFTQ